MSRKAPPHPELEEMMKKFPDTYQIVEMLNYFQRQHNENQSALHASGEGRRCKPFDIQTITMYQIKDYIYGKEGLKL